MALSMAVRAQQVTVSPMPQDISWGGEAFVNTTAFTLVGADDADSDAVALLQSKLNTTSGTVDIVIGESGDASVAAYEANIPNKAEGYYLLVTPSQVVIAGRDQSGTYYGVQTFLQIVSQPNVMQCEVKDWPSVALRGVIEGFYGNPWSTTDRKRQFEFYGQNKMNVYVYGPKDDAYHRGQWRTPYPEAEGNVIKELAEYAKQHKVKFTWAIHPGGDIQFNETDYQNLVAKLENVYSLGVRSFSIFFDDINNAEGANQAAALNYVTENFVRVHDDVEPLSMCPTQYNKAYAGGQSTPYLQALGNDMYPEIQIMWTGNSVVDMINASDADWVSDIIKRKPYIWLNYPVNDYCINHMLMGKTYGNDLDIADKLEAFASNPMEYAEASKVSLYSIADYSWNMADYDAENSWLRAIKTIMPTENEAFLVFCENNVDLGNTAHGLRRENESPRFREAMSIFETAMQDGTDVEAVAAMRLQMDTLVWAAERLLAAESTYPEMLSEITPWVRKMQFMGQRGQLIMDMYIDLLENKPAEFLEKYQQIVAIQAEEDALASRDFVGTIKKAKPVVGAEVIDPFLKTQLGTLVQMYKTSYTEGWENFGSVVLENGTYYIKVNGHYLTNVNAGADNTGDYPMFRSEVDITNPQKAEWYIAIDPTTDRYRITNAQDGRYLNEKGAFWANKTNNPYEAVWHSYNLLRLNGKYAIQNGGSAGTKYWTANDTRISAGTNGGVPTISDFMFEIVPVSGTAVEHPCVDSENSFYIKDTNGRYLTDVSNNGTGTPKFVTDMQGDGTYQKWMFSQDVNGRWKISSKAKPTAFINEKGVFSVNAFYSTWNTYVLTEMDGKWSIQNAEEAGTNFWSISDDVIQTNGNDRTESYVFILESANDAEPELEPDDETIYTINFDKNQVYTHSSRRLNGITLQSADGDQNADISTSAKVYNMVNNRIFCARAGEEVIAGFNYSGNWMHGFVYMDQGRDGQFDATLNSDGTYASTSDIMAFSYAQPSLSSGTGYNSKGEHVTSINVLQPPSFHIPAGLANGFYRMRYKVDWASIEPGGRMTETNDIITNGGAICDIILNVHDEQCNVSVAESEGGGLAIDGTIVREVQVPFGQPLTLEIVPNDGKMLESIVVKHGYNLDGEQKILGITQYREETLPAYLLRDSKVTLPAQYIDGDVRITASFISAEAGIKYENYSWPDGDKVFTDTELEAATDIVKRISGSATKGGTRTINVPDELLAHSHRNLIDGKELSALPGDRVIVRAYDVGDNEIIGTGKKVTLYVDLNQDGHFGAGILDSEGNPTLASELVAIVNGNTAMAFNTHELMPYGKYRARLVVGDKTEENNCATATDFLLNVHPQASKLIIHATNGSVNGNDVSGLPDNLIFGISQVLRPVPVDDGYVAQVMTIRHGHNLDGEQYINGNKQWSEYNVSATDAYTMPADSVDGEVRASVDFIPESSDYKLVFSDEFNGADGTQPDETKWTRCLRYSSTWNRWLSINDEEHALTGYIEDGKLATLAIPNPYKESDDVDMITGGIKSMGKFGFTYGKVECRLKTNPWKGNFPALWMMPENQSAGWPNCGEIDIWEAIDTESKSYHTVHSGWTNLGNRNNPPSSHNKNVNQATWHTYSLVWSATSIKWYVDGVYVGSYNKSTSADALSKGQWPFDKHFHLILNQSVGNGSWAAEADITHTYRTEFDWVRVYQLAGQTSTDINDIEDGTADSANASADNDIYDITGRIVVSNMTGSINSYNLPAGIYVMRGQKVIVK